MAGLRVNSSRLCMLLPPHGGRTGLTPRYLSTGAPHPLREYLVHIPDLPDALPKRLAARKAHIEGATPMIEAGRLPFFGITLAHHPAAEEQPAMNGSIMVIKAENEKDVREFVMNDAYTKGGAWDAERMTIWPFISG